MPVITVEMFEGRSKEQKAQFSKELTELAARVLKTEKEHVWIIYRDQSKSNWSMGGKLCD